MSLIRINIDSAVVSTSAAKFKVKDDIIYLPSSAKSAFATAISEIKKAAELIIKAAPKLDFYDDSKKRQYGQHEQYKREAAKRKQAGIEYKAEHKQAQAHIKAAKAALKEAGFGSIRPAFGSEIITNIGRTNASFAKQFKPDTFRVPGNDRRMKVKFVDASKIASISAVSDEIESESAKAKAPSYKLAKVSGATTLVISSANKSELQDIVGLLKKAKAHAVAGITASIKGNTAATKARQLPKGDRKTAMMQTRKTEKAKATSEIRSAKDALTAANKVAKSTGFGGLNLALSASDIKTGVGATAALKAIRAAKVTEFGVTGKRGTFKPKFVKESVFETIGQKATSKKPSHAESIKNTKARITARRAKEDAAAKLVTHEDVSKAVNKSLKKVLKKIGLKNEGTRLVDKKGELLTKNGATRQHTIDDIREEFEAAGLKTKNLANGGFVVPGVFKINNSKYFGIEASPLKNWVHPDNMKK